MADMMSILASNYTTVGATTLSKTPYVAVDASKYEGVWEGKYADNKSFKFTISNVVGFRAKVRYQSEGTLKYQDVLIKDGAFKIADSKFTLTKENKAQIKTVVTSPVTGATSLETAYAARDT